MITNINLQTFAQKCEINETLFGDLDIFQSQDENTVIRKLNYCKTPFGFEVLKKIIKTPITNIELLKKRQAYIEHIVNNEEVYLDLGKNLEIVGDNYKNILWFMYNHDDELLQFAIQQSLVENGTEGDQVNTSLIYTYVAASTFS